MTFEEFLATIGSGAKPEGLSRGLEALWFDARGEWDAAHERVQDEPTRAAAWVHAYLHRKEGDEANAAYWYSGADRPASRESLTREWESIARALLGANQ